MQSLALIGCGKMGAALLSGWKQAGILKNYDAAYVIDPSIDALQELNITYARAVSDIPVPPRHVVIAVKPQSLDNVLPQLAKQFGTHSLYISIAAGKPISYYRSHLGEAARVVRSMPNTPALVGKGVTALVAEAEVSPAGRQEAEILFAAVGSVHWLESEEEMHAVTALSGSGPAYVFYLAEAMSAAGKALDLPPAMADALARETLIGAAALLAQSEKTPTVLRTEVTSPGGTTEAALNILAQQNIMEAFQQALRAGMERSKELARTT